MSKQMIYVVEVDDGNHVSILTRYVIIADDANHAGRIAAKNQWPSATDEARAGMEKDGRVTVGVLGPYDPGITGARMTPTTVVAVQHEHKQEVRT